MAGRIFHPFLGITLGVILSACGAENNLESGTSQPVAQPALIKGHRLTVDQEEDFRSQIERCWIAPTEAVGRDGMVVEIRVRMRIDGTVRAVAVKDSERVSKDPFLRAVADSARRAVMNPRCNPWKLPPDKYDQWKEMVIVFNLSEMMER